MVLRKYLIIFLQIITLYRQINTLIGFGVSEIELHISYSTTINSTN